jgi:hypothetical protein
MAKKTTSIQIGRDSETGQFIPVEKDKKHPKTTTVEKVEKKKGK